MDCRINTLETIMITGNDLLNKSYYRLKNREEKLCYKIKNIGMERPEDVEKANEFCEGYKVFLDNAKIE